MEDRDNSVINALKRLERAGSEHSRTTQKLIEAADKLAEHIETALVGMMGPPKGAHLPRGYDLGWTSVQLFYQDDAGTQRYLGHGQATRESALHFAHDIATGWLEELAEWVKAQAGEGSKAHQLIDGARAGAEVAMAGWITPDMTKERNPAAVLLKSAKAGSEAAGEIFDEEAQP